MAYQGVQLTSKLETVLANGISVEAGIEYEASTGNTRVRLRGPLGVTSVGIVGTKILMENGKWTDYAKTNLSEATRAEWLPIIKESIRKAQKNCGGLANNCKLPGWIEGDNTSSTTVDVSDEFLGFDGTTTTLLDTSKDKLHINDFSTVTKDTIKALMPSGGSLNYPTDALYKRNNSTGFNQDHVRITQYTYQPPRADLVGAGKGGFNQGKEAKDKAKLNILDGVKRTSPLKEYLGMVKLPMPTDINDSNNVSWGEDSMNNLSAAVTSLVGANMGRSAAAGGIMGTLGSIFGIGNAGAGVQGDILMKAWESGLFDEAMGSGNAKALAGSALQSRLLAAAGFQVSPEDILARGLGVIPNANLELLFNSPTLREFQFAWKMTPRDAMEAKRIRNIIRFFKQGMAARKRKNKAGDPSMFLGTPNVFNLQYKTNHELDIAGVNRLKTCAVTGCAVNYTPDGIWSAYEDGQPVSTVMSLRMQELEPLYDTDYQTPSDDTQRFSDRPADIVSGTLHDIDINEVGY